MLDSMAHLPVRQPTGDLRAQRLKRVFHIDIETFQACGGAVKVSACIEDPVVIKTILDHLDDQDKPPEDPERMF